MLYVIASKCANLSHDGTSAAHMIAGTYNVGLIALSLLIAIVASYAAFDLGDRVSASEGQRRLAWLTSGAIGMGFAIWSMHYVGMLAFVLPVPVLYHVPTVVLSLVAAVAGAAIALYIPMVYFGECDHPIGSHHSSTRSVRFESLVLIVKPRDCDSARFTAATKR